MAQPDLIPAPFAENATPGTIEPIPPLTPSVPQQATWSSGFPQVTMQPLAAGGIPPRGQDFNGVLNALSQHIFHTQGGGQYKWSDDHGPYSIGDVLQSDDGLRSYVSVVDNNTDNFNTNPSSIGTSWLPWSGGAASELVAGLVKIATTAQAQSGINDASAMTPAKTGILFPFRGIQVYDTPGVHTWNVPDGVSKVWVTVIGGGGGGGGVQTTAGVSAAGGGGGGGGGVQELIEIISVGSVAVTVGAGGVGGQLSNGWSGLQGGTSSFGAYCSASGGRGGNGGSVSSNTVFSGAGGGEGVGGDINSVGNGGTDGTFSSPSGASVFGGNGGGPSFLGGGADGGAAGSAGNDAVGGGSGGAGAAAVGNSAHRGGNGAPGKIIIQW